MDALSWILVIARIQAIDGGGVGIMDLWDATKYSRSTIHRELRKLIIRNLVVRISRGKYRLNDSNEFLRSVGFSVLLPMDIYEYHSKMSLELRDKKSA